MKENTKEKMKYIIIGIIIGVALFYLLTMFRIIRPFGFPGDLGNFSGNLSRRFNRSATP
jgi:dolichol kinase